MNPAGFVVLLALAWHAWGFLFEVDRSQQTPEISCGVGWPPDFGISFLLVCLPGGSTSHGSFFGVCALVFVLY